MSPKTNDSMSEQLVSSKPKFRVFHFCFAMDASYGGVPTGVSEVAMQLSPYGIESEIFSYGNTKLQVMKNTLLYGKLLQSGVKVNCGSTFIENQYGLGRLKKNQMSLFDNPKPDIIILHQIYTLSTIIGYRFAKVKGIPYAVFPHGSLTDYQESNSSFIKYVAKKLIINKIIEKADLIITTSENERGDLESSLLSKVKVIPYGIEKFFKQGETLFPNFSFVGGPKIMFSGRFHKGKNLQLLIAAMPEILLKYPEAILEIAGAGTKRETKAIQELIQLFNLEQNIKFHGWVEKTKLMLIYVEADLLVLPSENENFSLVVAEALSQGIPCVVSKSVGISDIILKHHAGEIINELNSEAIAKAILLVLQGDSNEYRNSALQAAEENLDWSRISLIWISLIKAIVVQ
jgi:glycosyltransferase involved in cell wall biosynthesis